MEQKRLTRKRILILENAVDVTGGFKSILNSSIYLKNEFTFIFAIQTNSNCKKSIVSNGFEAIEFPFQELSKSLMSIILYVPVLVLNVFRLRRLLKKFKIDLIVANDFYNVLPACYRLFGGRVPYICFVRFLPVRFPKVLTRFWCLCHHHFSSCIISVSQAVKRQLLPYESIVIYEGLPNSPLEDQETDRKVGDTPSVILYLANYIEGKGQQYALHSFAVFAKKYPSWKLKFVGGDMGLTKNKLYRAGLIQLADELGLKEQTVWSSFKENVFEEYRSASIVLNFSYSESFSLTCLEAMAAGRPVISTNSGGPSEIIDHMQNGILVPIANIDEMSKAMELLITNTEIREEMGRMAYAHVRSKFNSKFTTEVLREIYLRN